MWLVLCDTWNRSDDNDTVSGIAILDTTAIPEMRYAISVFFRNRQSHRPTLVMTEMCVSSSVPTVCTLNKAIACCVYCMKCAPASVNIKRSQAVAIRPYILTHSTWESRDVIGHVTVWCPMWSSLIDHLEQSLSPAVYEILCSKRIGVTSLTFYGHVTSSVTLPFDILHMPFPIGGPLD